MTSEPTMNAAERLGVFLIFTEFKNHVENAFGPPQNPFSKDNELQKTIYFMLREIDTIRHQGFLLNTIQQNQIYFQKVAIAGCIGCQSFESQTFDTQLFLMNLASFILRVLTRIH